MNWIYLEDYDTEYMWLETRCAAATVRQEYFLNLCCTNHGPYTVAEGTRINNHTVEPGPLRVPVASPSICDVTLERYRTLKGRITTDYRIDVASPK